MRRCTLLLLASLAAGCASAGSGGADPASGPATSGRDSADADLPTIEAHTEGMQQFDGFLPLYWNEEDGKIWLEIDRLDEELLHYTSLPAGLGQNDIGLNRGDLGPSHVVVFRRVGPRVLMVEPNYGFRAVTDNPMERRSVEDGFPTSVHWGFEVEAQTEDRVLVDATDFFLRDWHDVVGTLRRTNQGTWRLESSRSAIHLPRTKAFPENTEVELTLTFTSDQPGGLSRSVSATSGILTVRQHHSFVELPPLDGSFEPRPADPRAGYFGISYFDYAQPIEEPLVQRYIARHRLEKQDPAAEASDPVEPIIYYLDPGTPEPVRTALLEGGRWWNEAFEAAGYRDAFRVEMLPDTADPMDVRYNVIQWVHRSTRGWSYGSSISDPRTGEILKGHVTLGSLRVRQDYLLGEGLLSPYATGDEQPQEVLDMALLRIRQLSAHEIGHTLGLAHNYIASAQRDAGNQSVMDYPHPRATLEDGQISLADAYDRGIGEWDKVAIRYGYQDFPQGADEEAALDAILAEAQARGVTFISDQDARPAGSAHPEVHLWDNGADVAAELERMMDVRRVALDRFGEAAIRSGTPLATIEEALVPLYLHHRYQAEAASKVVAGQYYTYALRGDGQEAVRMVPAGEQEAALEALMRTLDVEELKIPEPVLSQLPPRPYGWGRHQELFDRWTGLVFDAVSPAAAAADATLGMLLHQERAARMVEQSALDPSLPSLEDVLGRLRQATFDAPTTDAYAGEISRVVERAYVEQLMRLATGADMPQVRAVAARELHDLRGTMEGRMASANAGDRAHFFLLSNEVERFLDRPMEEQAPDGLPDMPPGSPIGDPAMTWAGLACSWW